MRRSSLTKAAVGLATGTLIATGLIWGQQSAHAVTLNSDDQFVLDFIASGDGSGNLSNFPVAVYWKWDGDETLGIRMEAPQGSTGFPGFTANGFWSFNVFCDGSSPGGLNSNGDNTTSVTPISVGAFSAASLGAFAVPVDAVEATWVQPCSGGAFDPSQTAIYIQLTIGGANFPSDGYRMADYLGQGGTYADPPDIFFPADGFCATTEGTCAELDFVVPKPEDVVDHFICYQVSEIDKLSPSVQAVIDQFIESDLEIRKAKEICVPANKNGEGILNGDVHLVCYDIRPKERVDRDVAVTNQLTEEEAREEGQRLTVRRARTFCVPSFKEDLGPTGGDDDDDDDDD